MPFLPWTNRIKKSVSLSSQGNSSSAHIFDNFRSSAVTQKKRSNAPEDKQDAAGAKSSKLLPGIF